MFFMWKLFKGARATAAWTSLAGAVSLGGWALADHFARRSVGPWMRGGWFVASLLVALGARVVAAVGVADVVPAEPVRGDLGLEPERVAEARRLDLRSRVDRVAGVLDAAPRERRPGEPGQRIGERPRPPPHLERRLLLAVVV